MIQHTKNFGIYHWDTFDNITMLMSEANTLKKAIDFVKKEYKGRISSDGADQVDIVDKNGNIVRKFNIC